ncbi:MAG: GGDEF domain-containing protein [Pseudomonadota bacterium]
MTQEERELGLDKFNSRLLSLYRDIGGGGIIACVTIFAIVMSEAITAVGLSSQIRSGAFTPQDTRFAFVLAGVIPAVVAPAASVLIVRLLGHLDSTLDLVLHLSTTDPLTGTYNRRGFFTALSRLIGERSATRSCLVGMVDMDRFKELNDSFGLDIGDRALIRVSEALRELIGDYGIVGRFGGDEFAFVISAEHGEAECLEHALQTQCTTLTLPLPSELGRGPDEVSCSIGTTWLQEDEDVSRALTRADRSLYERKQQRKPLIRARHLALSDGGGPQGPEFGARAQSA